MVSNPLSNLIVAFNYALSQAYNYTLVKLFVLTDGEITVIMSCALEAVYYR